MVRGATKFLISAPALFGSLGPTWAQQDMSQLRGKFITCEQVPLLGLYSMHVRSRKYACPGISGFVMHTTPVKSLRIEVDCPGKETVIVAAKTSSQCNTIDCLTNPLKLMTYAKRGNIDCYFDIKSAELFEYYPVFSTAGPRVDEKFLETATYNNEDDPHYLARINARLPVTDQTIGTEEDDRGTKENKEPVADLNLKDKLCEVTSFEALPKEALGEYLKLTFHLYQNPDFKEEKLQRKLFCLLKDHYEKTEDYEKLLDLVSKMKFEKENCSSE